MIALLERAKSLKWLMVASAGVDKMPLAEIADMGYCRDKCTRHP